MKKAAKIFIGVFILLLIGATSMFVFKLCPPEGPWIKPPWCEGSAYIPFKYTELNYIKKTYQPTNKKLDFIVGTMDMWGNPHLLLDLGEDTKDNVKSTLKKISEIGAEGLYLTDFAQFTSDLQIKEGSTGAETISQKELEGIVSTAKQLGLKKVILIVNLYNLELGFSRWRKGDTTNTNISQILSSKNKENWKKLFENWNEFLKNEAQKASKAGVDYLVVVPGDFVFSNTEDKEILNSAYKLFADTARKFFKGKIGIFLYYNDVAKIKEDTLKKFDFVVVSWDPNGDYMAREIFKNVKEDPEEIKKAFKIWLSLPSWQHLKDKEIFLSITMPSYDGALQKGWIEPGGTYGPEYKKDYKEQALAYEALFRSLYENDFNISGIISYGYWWTDRIYPEVRVLRNDLSHSIRNKDAEKVFYKWSKVFK